MAESLRWVPVDSHTMLDCQCIVDFWDAALLLMGVLVNDATKLVRAEKAHGVESVLATQAPHHMLGVLDCTCTGSLLQ